MDPRAFNFCKGLNCPFEFALHGALVCYLFIEFGLTPGHFVEEFEAHPAAMGLTLRCRLQAGSRELVCRNTNRLSIRT